MGNSNVKCKVIDGYEDYLVYSDGRVYSKKSEKFLKAGKHSCGYMTVLLYKEGINLTKVIFGDMQQTTH